jgi:hypothetical protein
MRFLSLLLLITFAPILRADDTDFLPLRMGNTWTYRVQNQDERFVVKVVTGERIGDQYAYRLEGFLRDRSVASEVLGHTSEGLIRFRVEREDILPPLPLLPHPIDRQKGAQWEASFKLGARSGVAKFTSTHETITVPAGKYDAIAVQAELSEGSGSPIKSTLWFAPQVGIIKQEIVDGKRTTVLELEKFETRRKR